VGPAPPRAPQYRQQTPEQFQQLVAPIALYPDSPVAQILAASTFPKQVVEAARWVRAHSDVFRHLEQHRKHLLVNLDQLSNAESSILDTW
jgi:hypothetical protein